MVGFFKKYLKPEDPMDFFIIIVLLLGAVGGSLMVFYAYFKK